MDEFIKAWMDIQKQSASVAIEYKIYYDPDSGNILDYTTDQHSGAYIVVDRETFAKHRFEYKIKDGKLIPPKPGIGKLQPSKTGTPCHPADITIVVNNSNATYWKNHTYDNS
jgi:hypothetical protein